MTYIKQQLLNSNMYQYKCPYSMKPVGICIHNTWNDASAQNEITNMTKESNKSQVSFHIAVDDMEAIQGIPFNRNAWASGDGANGIGNRRYIHVEICYSKSGGTRFEEAEKRASKVVAELLKQYGWTTANVKAHRNFANKNCPHRTDMNNFIRMVDSEMNGETFRIVTGGMSEEYALNKLSHLQALTGWYAVVEKQPNNTGYHRIVTGGFVGENVVSSKLNALVELTGWYATYERI